MWNDDARRFQISALKNEIWEFSGLLFISRFNHGGRKDAAYVIIKLDV
ncbi:hypothetical protein Hanom_Chr09g00791821 [Helianthus anomalus]